MNKDCVNCEYGYTTKAARYDTPTKGGGIQEYLFCRRYPEPILVKDDYPEVTKANYYCGEHKFKEGLKGK